MMPRATQLSSCPDPLPTTALLRLHCCPMSLQSPARTNRMGPPFSVPKETQGFSGKAELCWKPHRF